jgi:large conductance mechanosensitive channel
MHRKKKEPDAPPTPSKEEILLEEIRDILKERSS